MTAIQTTLQTQAEGYHSSISLFAQSCSLINYNSSIDLFWHLISIWNCHWWCSGNLVNV